MKAVRIVSALLGAVWVGATVPVFGQNPEAFYMDFANPVKDLGPNGHSLTAIGKPSKVPGICAAGSGCDDDTACEFDGVDDQFVVRDINLNTHTASFAFWTQNTEGTIFQSGCAIDSPADQTQGFFAEVIDEGVDRVFVWGTRGAGLGDAGGEIVYANDGQVHHFVVTYDFNADPCPTTPFGPLARTGGTFLGYRNGVQESANYNCDTRAFAYAGSRCQDLYIGANADGSNRLSGTLDNFWTFGHALGDADVTTLAAGDELTGSPNTTTVTGVTATPLTGPGYSANTYEFSATGTSNLDSVYNFRLGQADGPAPYWRPKAAGWGPSNKAVYTLPQGEWCVTALGVDKASLVDWGVSYSSAKSDTIVVDPLPNLGLSTFNTPGGGIAIYFEAEAAERPPGAGSQILADTRAFGGAVATGGGGLCYTIDLDLVGASGGIWYLWTRGVNPINRSDWVYVNGVFVGRFGEQNVDVDVYKYYTGEGDDPCTPVAGAVLVFTDGVNVLKLELRQGDGTTLYDNFVVTDDPAYKPDDTDALSTVQVVETTNPGDADGDGEVDIDDVLVILSGFTGRPGAEPVCEEALDANGDGVNGDVGDLVFMLQHIYQGGPPPVGKCGL